MFGLPTQLSKVALAQKLTDYNWYRDTKVPYKGTILTKVQLEIHAASATFTLTNNKGYSWVEEFIVTG